MKKILLCMLALCLVLSLFACDKNEIDNSNADATTVSKTLGETSSESMYKDYESFLSFLKTDSKYSSWRAQGYEQQRNFSYEIESYETDTYTYYSVICEAEGIDHLVRFLPDSENSSFETLYNGEWIKCIHDSDVKKFLGVEKHREAFNVLIGDGNTTDNTVTVFDNTYTSKRKELESNIYLDYLCRDGKWDAVALTAKGEGVIILFDNFVFSTEPTQKSRFYNYLEAPTNKALVSTYMLSDSMSPALKLGNLYCFDTTAIDSIAVGDIVLAYSETLGAHIAHRVAAIREDGSGYVLRADNTGVDDPDIFTAEDIRGVLVTK